MRFSLREMMALTTGVCIGTGCSLAASRIVPPHIFGLCVAVGGLSVGLILAVAFVSLYFG